MDFIDVLSMASDVLYDKYVRLCIRLLGTEILGSDDTVISHRMTIDRDIVPLYKAIVSLGGSMLDLRIDRNQSIQTLTIYSILRVSPKNRDYNIYYDKLDRRFILSITKNSIPIYTYEDFEKNNSSRAYKGSIPEDALLPGSDIDSILTRDYGDTFDYIKSVIRLDIMVYKINRVAKIIFEEIPPCKNRNKKRSNYKEDIDFLFQ